MLKVRRERKYNGKALRMAPAGFGAGFGIPIPVPGSSTRTRHPPHTRRRVEISTIPATRRVRGTRPVPAKERQLVCGCGLYVSVFSGLGLLVG